MEAIKEILSRCKEEIRVELAKLKLLKGKNLEEFKNVFNLEGDIEIYFNTYNIVFTDGHIYDQLKPYLGQNSLIIRLELSESNTNLWVHQYFNEQIFNDYLK